MGCDLIRRPANRSHSSPPLPLSLFYSFTLSLLFIRLEPELLLSGLVADGFDDRFIQ